MANTDAGTAPAAAAAPRMKFKVKVKGVRVAHQSATVTCGAAAVAQATEFAAPKAVMDDLVAKGQTLDLPYVVTKLRGMGHTVVPVPSAGVNCSTMRTADESDQRITCVVYLGGQGSRGRGRRSGPGAQLVSHFKTKQYWRRRRDVIVLMRVDPAGKNRNDWGVAVSVLAPGSANLAKEQEFFDGAKQRVIAIGGDAVAEDARFDACRMALVVDNHDDDGKKEIQWGAPGTPDHPEKVSGVTYTEKPFDIIVERSSNGTISKDWK